MTCGATKRQVKLSVAVYCARTALYSASAKQRGNFGARDSAMENNFFPRQTAPVLEMLLRM
jgi:hypothetical protein